MDTTRIHHEDVKAVLRKRYGSIENFAAMAGVKSQAVRDLLRGKSSTGRAAIARELGVEPDHLVIISAKVPFCGTHTKDDAKAHRQNGGAK